VFRRKPRPAKKVSLENDMPVQKAKGGYRWGKSGKVYRGKGAKSRAARQGRAIKVSQHAKKR